MTTVAHALLRAASTLVSTPGEISLDAARPNAGAAAAIAVWLACGSIWAQTAAEKPPTPPTPRTAAIPSPKDLKFPPLRSIQPPNVESATLPNGLRLFLMEDHRPAMVNGQARCPPRTGSHVKKGARRGQARERSEKPCVLEFPVS